MWSYVPKSVIKRERERVKKGTLRKAVYIARLIVRDARSRRVSIRLRTLIKYAYASYALKEEKFNIIRGKAAKIKVPRYLFHKDFYKAVEEALTENFDVEFETRNGYKRYAVITVRPVPILSLIKNSPFIRPGTIYRPGAGGD